MLTSKSLTSNETEVQGYGLQLVTHNLIINQSVKFLRRNGSVLVNTQGVGHFC
jgi:hypothetical protein